MLLGCAIVIASFAWSTCKHIKEIVHNSDSKWLGDTRKFGAFNSITSPCFLLCRIVSIPLSSLKSIVYWNKCFWKQTTVAFKLSS